MPLAQHLWDLSLCLIILLGPIPFCLSIILIAKNENETISFSHAFLVLLTFWCVIEISLSLLLGMVQLLNLQATLIAESLLFVVGTIFFIHLKRRHSPTPQRNSFISLPKFNAQEALIVIVISAIAVTLLWQLMAEPITNYDSLAYHLPVMAKWYQTASFSILNELGQTGRYPYNWEALCALFTLPFCEDFAVAWPNLAAWAILGLAIYRVNREIGVTRIHGMVPAALVLMLPVLTQTVNTMHIDLPLASFIVCGFYWVLYFHRTRSLSSFVLFLATLGMLAGIKTSAPFYGFLLIITFVGLEIETILRRHKLVNSVMASTSMTIPLVVVALLCCFFLGSFWYIRNFIDLGNPLGFVKVQLGEYTLFPGTWDYSYFRQTTLAHLFNLTSFSDWKILIGEIKQYLNLPFLAILVQALLAIFTFVIGQTQIKKVYLIVLLAVLVGTGYLYWNTPSSGDNGTHNWKITPWISLGFRFAFSFLGFLGVAAAVGATIIRARDEGLVAIVMICSMLAMAGTMMRYAIIVVLVFWGLMIEISRASFNPGVSRILKRLSWVAAVNLLIMMTFNARQERELQRGKAYFGVLEFLANHVRQDETIGYLLSHQSYLFYGKKFDRQVLYVPAESENLSDWLALLQEKGVSVVAIGPLRGNWESRREVSWLEDPEGPFVRIFGEKSGSEPFFYRFKSKLNTHDQYDKL